jgi:hypothetical protein
MSESNNEWSPEGAELHPREHERLMRLLHRSDALNNAYWTVLENSERNSEETKVEILDVLNELRKESDEAFDRYRREVALPERRVETRQSR